jgi:type II secretory pathway pseudopilin PulG
MRDSPRLVIGDNGRTTTRKDQRRSESGDTLIEILMAVVVLGMAAVALIIAFGTSISASADHRQLSASGIALDSISQEVNADIQSTPSLFTCPYVFQNFENATFSSSSFSVPTGFTATFASPSPTVPNPSPNPIEYEVLSSNTFLNTCVAGQPLLVTISVTDLTNSRTYTNSFVVDSPLDTVTGSQTTAIYGTASQLKFTTEPTGGSTGQLLATQPVVTVQDSIHNTVLDDLSPVLLTLVQSVTYQPVTNGATLSGCSGTETEGVVTFSGCAVNVSGTYAIAATDGDFSGTFYSTAFTVSASTDYLVFQTQPVAGASGFALTTQPVVWAENSGGLDSSWSGTITLTASGGSLTNCSAITVNHGVGTFTSCDFAGAYYYNSISGVYLATPYTLTATASNSVATSPATSTTIEVTGPGSASQLVFSTQPTGSASATLPAAFATEPVVTIEDSFGNSLTSSTAPISLSISQGTLKQCVANPLSASGGSAAFSGCGGSVYGNGLTLTASSSGLSSTTSASFNITYVASKLVFTTQPVAGVSGTVFQTQPVVTVEDVNGNTVTASSTAITLASVNSSGTAAGLLQLCTNLTPYEGVVTVQTCNFAGIVGTAYYLDATQGSLTATSGVFSPTTAGTPTKLVFVTQPVAGRAGSAFATQPVVDIEDSGGNVTTSSATISLSASGGSLASCSNLSAVQGVVEVTGCTFGGLDTASYTLTATSNGLSSATSSNFTPSGPGPVSPTQSTVVASPSIVLDNGSAFATVTVTLEDAYTNVISGDSVMLAQGSTSSVISPNPVVSGSNGVAAFSVTDSHHEIATYTASDVTESTILAEQAQVSFATQLTPTTHVTLSYGTTAGSIGVTFTAPSNAPGGQLYSAEACTDSGMTQNCVGPETIASPGQITGLTYTQGNAGTAYYVTITASASTGYLASTSTDAGPQNATSQVDAPTITNVSPSTTTAGALTVTFTASSGTAPSSYSAYACTGPGMTGTCVGPETITSGGQIIGLTAGTGYYVALTANPPAGYVSASSSVVGPVTSTIQLIAPTGVTLSYGSVAGSIGVTFAPSSNSAGGQLYSAKACTDAGMTQNCVGPETITSGGQITGLTYTQGSAGTAYHVTITASASTGYLAAASTDAGPQNATSQVNAPTITNVTPSTTAGALTVTLTSTGSGVASYSAAGCTSSGSGCGAAQAITSGGQITGLTQGSQYYVTVTAVATAGSGYVSNSSSNATSTMATVQLATPTITGVAPSITTAGALTVNFTGSTNAPSGQVYTAAACTGSGSGCGTAQAIASGGQITGLTQGSQYYVQLIATASVSPGYLASAPANTTASYAASTLTIAPSAVTLAYGSVAGSINVTFTDAGAGIASYTAEACTQTGLGGTCHGPVAITSGGQITGLPYVAGSLADTYYVTVATVPQTGYVSSSTQVGPQAATSQVIAPTNVTVAPSSTTANAVTVTFTNSTGSGLSGTYTGEICTALGSGCSAGSSQTVTSTGTTFTGLTSGTNYYAQVTANSTAGYLSALANGGPSTPAVQIGAISTPSLNYGTTAGSLTVTYTASGPAAMSQAYTALACTVNTMNSGCVGPASIVTGGQITGLTPGTPYFVTITATASTGYLASTSPVSTSYASTQQTSPPATVTAASGTSTSSGSLVVTFSSSSTSGVPSYTSVACTGVGTGCTAGQTIVSGGQITGLTPGTAYYVTVTANAPSSAYVSGSTTTSSTTVATEQLLSTGVTVTSGGSTSSGSLTVNLTAPTNAPSGQTYTAAACTSSGSGCGTAEAITSGGQITGLTLGTNYYVQVVAVASSGYLASTTNSASATTAAEKLNAPTNVSATNVTNTTFTVAFTASSGAPSGTTYSALVCTNSAMTTCITVTPSTITSGSTVTVPNGDSGDQVWVEVTATGPFSYYLSATSTTAFSLGSA